MIPMNRAFAAAIASVAALGLSACALLSTPDPVQLYRFGANLDLQSEGLARAGTRPVALRRVQFPRASSGERILAVTGDQAAYLAGARWVSPADVLFTDALENSFSVRSRQVRLIGRNELTPADLMLELDVRQFEARYDAGQGAAPTVHMVVHARMLQYPERVIAEERTFATTVPAADNRVSAIVAAYSAGTDQITDQIVQWSDTVAARPQVPAR